ncbi:ABC transporter substrate-binding protein [Planctomycetota bacterium]|nr:ABC transporter substrate-binding protein [Planctomycetota bacterium]
MKNDDNNTLNQIGIGLIALLVVLVIQLGLLLGSVRTIDEHGQGNFNELEEALEDQDEALRDLNAEVRRLQDQRRTADELKMVMNQGLTDLAQELRTAPQQQMMVPVYQQQGQPQQVVQQPVTQPGTQPVEQEPATQEPVEQGGTEGEGAGNTEAMGSDDTIPMPDPNAVVGGTLVETRSEPSTLNMYITTEGDTKQVMKYIIEPLFGVSEQDPTQLQGLLATAWETSEDRLTYTYHLRRGVTWSDGAPFTADDVVFTYNTIMDPAVKSEGYKASFNDVETVTKVDDFTVEVRYKRLYWKGLYVIGNTLYVIPKHWYEDRIPQIAAANNVEPYSVVPGEEGFGACFNEIHEPCVGTGPYVMDEFTKGERIVLQRNPTHWRFEVEPGCYNIQQIINRFIPNHTAQVNQVRQQNIDVIVVKRDEWLDSLQNEAVIRDNYEYTRYDHTGIGFNYVAWNCRQFPFDDHRVRQAMTHLIDREGLLRDLWRNNGVVATCPNKPVYPEYNTSFEALPFDLERAANLLREAGFSDQDGDGILDKMVDGELRPFEFEFKVPSGYDEFIRIAATMQEAMQRVGVRLKVRPLEWAVFIEHLYVRDFDAMCLYSSFADPWIDPYEDVHSSEDKPRGGNLPGLRMEEIDTLVQDMRTEFDRDVRIPMYHRLYEILHEQQPMTLLVHGMVNVLRHKRFQNVTVRHKGMRNTYWWVRPEDRLYDD